MGSSVQITLIFGSVVLSIIGIIGLGIFLQSTTSLNENEKTENQRPNILFIMLDDLGFNCVSWNNPIVQTPHMAALAAAGVILGKSYANNVCGPSRGEFLTGRYAHTMGVQNERGRQYIPLREKLLSERLQELGYDTHVLGKWNVGSCRKEYLPTRRGFDTFFGCRKGGIDSYTRCYQGSEENDTALDWYDQEKPFKSDRIHVTDLMKDRALQIIRGKTGEKPFFMFMSFTAPHLPDQAPEKYSKIYDGVKSEWHREYLGMVTHVDEAVGEIVNLLKSKRLFNNTIIAMTSDDGGLPGPSDNFPLRGGKQSLFEGGHRVPGFVFSKNFSKTGYFNNGRFHITDWVPTLLSFADGQAASDLEKENLDGLDQSEMLKYGGKSKRREIVYHIDTLTESKFGYAAISFDDYKLLVGGTGYYDGWTQDRTVGIVISINETFIPVRQQRIVYSNYSICEGTHPNSLSPETKAKRKLAIKVGKTQIDRHLLFNIRADPEERHDLSEVMPEKVKELKERLEKHLALEVLPPDGVKYLDPIPFQRDEAWGTGWCQA